MCVRVGVWGTYVYIVCVDPTTNCPLSIADLD